jgi:hypothetical protein
LNFPNPDRDAGQLGSVGVNLDALDSLRADSGKLPPEPEGFGIQIDFVFQVLESQNGEVEKVAGTTRGIEHTHLFQPIQKAVM